MIYIAGISVTGKRVIVGIIAATLLVFGLIGVLMFFLIRWYRRSKCKKVKYSFKMIQVK